MSYSKSKYRIQKVIFDVIIDRTSDALDLQEQLKQRFYNDIVPVLEELLEQYDQADKIISIDHLELDWDELLTHHSIPAHIIKDKIETGLKKAIIEADQKPIRYELTALNIDDLVNWLEQGYSNWHNENIEQDFQNVLKLSAKESTKKVAAFIKPIYSRLKSKSALIRLVQQLQSTVSKTQIETLFVEFYCSDFKHNASETWVLEFVQFCLTDTYHHAALLKEKFEASSFIQLLVKSILKGEQSDIQIRELYPKLNEKIIDDLALDHNPLFSQKHKLHIHLSAILLEIDEQLAWNNYIKLIGNISDVEFKEMSLLGFKISTLLDEWKNIAYLNVTHYQQMLEYLHKAFLYHIANKNSTNIELNPYSNKLLNSIAESEPIQESADQYPISQSLITERIKLDVDHILNPNDSSKATKSNDEQKETDLKNKAIYAPFGGLVLLAPFLENYCEALNYLDEKGLFKSEEFQFRTMAALCYAARFMSHIEHIEEQYLVIPKILCGIEISKAVPKNIQLNAQEIREMNELLQTICKYWTALKTKSIEALSESFIQREAKIELDDKSITISPEHQAFDILLAKLPYSISVIRLLWQPKIIYTQWG